MKKQLSYQKSSFILLETILSILILSIVISSFSKLSYNTNSDLNFKHIIKVHNNFNSKNYEEHFKLNNEKILLIINNTSKKSILVKKISYINKNIKLYKYEN